MLLCIDCYLQALSHAVSICPCNLIQSPKTGKNWNISLVFLYKWGNWEIQVWLQSPGSKLVLRYFYFKIYWYNWCTAHKSEVYSRMIWIYMYCKMIPIINKDPSSHMYKKQKCICLQELDFQLSNIPYSSVNCSSHVVYYILSIYLPSSYLSTTFIHFPLSTPPSDNHKSDLLAMNLLKKIPISTAFIIVWLVNLAQYLHSPSVVANERISIFYVLKYMYILENFFSHVGMYIKSYIYPIPFISGHLFPCLGYCK